VELLLVPVARVENGLLFEAAIALLESQPADGGAEK
jgi:hypothetical protein